MKMPAVASKPPRAPPDSAFFSITIVSGPGASTMRTTITR